MIWIIILLVLIFVGSIISNATPESIAIAMVLLFLWWLFTK